mgnify:CR=1 FL=1|jgi:RNA polymerase sigma-70 factor, ECF subfamily
MKPFEELRVNIRNSMGFINKISLSKWPMSTKIAKHAQENSSQRSEPISDEDLALSFQKGDDLAFQELLGRFRRPLFNFIMRYMGKKEAAEEVFQEVFLRVIKSISNYRPNAKFSTWVYTITRNYCIDCLRKAKFRNHYSLDEALHEKSKEYSNDDPLSDTRASANELNEHLQQMLTELSEEQREVFLLRQMQGLPFDEIAKVTGVSVNTVKSRMRYALKALQEKFIKIGITSAT